METVIRLFDKADFSTVVHEARHCFYVVLEHLASLDGAPQQMVGDLTALKAWMVPLPCSGNRRRQFVLLSLISLPHFLA